MTAVDKEKLDVQEKIERLPTQAQSSRKDSVDKYLLALERSRKNLASLP